MDIEHERRKLRLLKGIKMGTQSECWEWQLDKYPKGYGRFFWGKINGKPTAFNASRAAWKILVGDVAKGDYVLHKCHNPPCCNPNHLYVGSHEDNMRDRDEAGRTHKLEQKPNYKRTADLIGKLSELLDAGLTVQEACDKAGIKWRTFFRAKHQYPEFNDLVKRTKYMRHPETRKKAGLI